MDVQIKEYPTGQRATIWADHYQGIVYIDPRPGWKDPFYMKPFHGENSPKYIDLDRFMHLAVGWEGMLKSVWDTEGFMACVMLDMSCHKRKDFYDIFLDIHHD